jgi:cellulose synthase/poly-beta-1,6-N-acetylglucosamine synthase-like glycosyltransferase
MPLPRNPKYTPQDVTIIIATVGGQDTAKDLVITLNCCLREGAERIIITTIDRDLKFVQSLASSVDSRIEVVAIPKPNKRHQIARAVREVNTEIIVLCDNDMIWAPGLLLQLLAPFQRDKVGAVGPIQRIKKAENLTLTERMWEYLGACYKDRAVFETVAVSNIDGGVGCCLGGGTAAYRTSILKDEEFLGGYVSETWCGNILNADDDNFVTRRLIAKDMEIVIQTAPEAVIETTVQTNIKFLEQCLRWMRYVIRISSSKLKLTLHRSNWRSNITSTLYERHVWRKQPWNVYAVHLQTPMISFIIDPLLLYLLHRATESDTDLHRRSLWTLVAWMFFSKIFKLIPHFIRYPQDVIFIPVTIIFGYAYGFIKLYALFTLPEVRDQ